MPAADPIELPPQAPEAEKAVLGSCLIEREAADAVLDILDDKDFYQENHRLIYAAVKRLHAADAAVDVVTLAEEMRRTGALEAVGGNAYLIELVHAVETAAHAEHYGRIVKDKALLRDLIRVATAIVRDCHSQAKETTAVLEEAQALILKISQRQTLHGIYSSKDLAHEMIRLIEETHKNKKAVTGAPSGLSALDRQTSGFQKSELALIAARPSQGKTALGLNIATNAVLAKEPRSVLFFSLEMDRRQLMMRLISTLSRTNLMDVRNGFFPRDRWTHLTNATARLAEAPLYIVDNPGLSALGIRSTARQLKRDLARRGQPDLGMVIIDYLQLIREQGARRESRQQEVSDISRSLKFLARELEIPVIALSQLSRRTEEKGRPDQRPQLSDLRESGALEQDADLVIFIYREGYYKPNDPSVDQTKAELIIAKQRQGPTGIVPVRFVREHTLFGDAAADEEPEDVPILSS